MAINMQLELHGFRFHPTENELLCYYLKPKITGERVFPPGLTVSNIPVIEDLYLKSPEDIVNQVSVRVDREFIYAFTRVKPVAKKKGGKKIARATKQLPASDDNNERIISNGNKKTTWKMQSGKRVKLENGEIGKHHAFTYSAKGLNGTYESLHWIIHEYSLPALGSDWVICRMHYDKKRGLPPSDSSDHGSTSSSCSVSEQSQRPPLPLPLPAPLPPPPPLLLPSPLLKPMPSSMMKQKQMSATSSLVITPPTEMIMSRVISPPSSSMKQRRQMNDEDGTTSCTTNSNSLVIRPRTKKSRVCHTPGLANKSQYYNQPQQFAAQAPQCEQSIITDQPQQRPNYDDQEVGAVQLVIQHHQPQVQEERRHDHQEEAANNVVTTMISVEEVNRQFEEKGSFFSALGFNVSDFIRDDEDENEIGWRSYDESLVRMLDGNIVFKDLPHFS